MPLNKSQVIRHSFAGGWATDLGPDADVAPDQSGKVAIPFLTEAQDCLYELDGGPHMIGGTSKVNTSAVASGAVVTGIYDYWRQGTAGTPSRRRVLHAGTVALADADDGAFTTTIGSGLTSGAVPSYFTFDDLLIFSSDSTTDVPRSWDQTTAQDLAGTPPRFSFGTMHKNRAWGAGNYAAPSRLYYSANVDPEDWVGAGSGNIDIDQNDGDMITGIVSYQNDLWVFKGPNKGSIHRITGSAPTGTDAYSRILVSRGIGACWHNAIFHFGDDIGFVSQYGSIHSLEATAAFGDFFGTALSKYINQWIRDHLNFNRLRYICTAVDHFRGVVYISMSIDSSQTNNMVLAMDFRNVPAAYSSIDFRHAAEFVRWSTIPAYKQASLGLFVDTNGVRRVFGGGNDGFVRRLNITDRSIDGATALSFSVRTPTLNYGNAMLTKTLSVASLGIAPKGAFDMTFGWECDDNAQQTFVTTQSGSGDVLGPATAHEFTLDTSKLGGARFIDRFMELEQGGEFRNINYHITQATVNADIELHSFSALITPGALSTEN